MASFCSLVQSGKHDRKVAVGTHCQAERAVVLAVRKDAVMAEGVTRVMVMAEVDMVAQVHLGKVVPAVAGIKGTSSASTATKWDITPLNAAPSIGMRR